ncbi:hypothetical protein [Aromatoleum aromaticum]|uniref:hypothetical protein n=1 Tax=Aromatoleum aromaticum TaxID=551760 RepID=UPI0012FED1D5|nr:hypothetical protein [Aromatoleum aromaticum]NMG56879.1 hypothetical protein [Aromatoleum aromaticum]
MSYALNAAEVRDIFDYRDGALYWRIQPSKGTRAGTLAGAVQRRRPCDRGREQHVIQYKRVRYTRGQLTWAWHYGVWPDRVLGRRNDDVLDDRIENLRVADVSAPRGAKNVPHFL